MRAVIDGVHRRDDGEKNLRRADVARRFVAADVLLARLQRETVGGLSGGIMRNANQPARHVAFVLIARGEICGMRSAEAERNAETLRAADRNIGAEFARRSQQSQRQHVRRDHDKRRPHARLAQRIRSRESHRRSLDIAPARRKRCHRIRIARNLHHDFDAERLGPGLDDIDRLRMAIVGDEEGLPPGNDRVTNAIASAAAVASSRSDAFAMSSAVRSVTMV